MTIQFKHAWWTERSRARGGGWEPCDDTWGICVDGRFGYGVLFSVVPGDDSVDHWQVFPTSEEAIEYIAQRLRQPMPV